jgi:hypothetical protein
VEPLVLQCLRCALLWAASLTRRVLHFRHSKVAAYQLHSGTISLLLLTVPYKRVRCFPSDAPVVWSNSTLLALPVLPEHPIEFEVGGGRTVCNYNISFPRKCKRYVHVDWGLYIVVGNKTVVTASDVLPIMYSVSLLKVQEDSLASAIAGGRVFRSFVWA